METIAINSVPGIAKDIVAATAAASRGMGANWESKSQSDHVYDLMGHVQKLAAVCSALALPLIAAQPEQDRTTGIPIPPPFDPAPAYLAALEAMHEGVSRLIELNAIPCRNAAFDTLVSLCTAVEEAR